MRSSSHLKWTLFVGLVSFHLILTWFAFEMKWYFWVIVAMGPDLILEWMGMRLSSCANFICLPSGVGWTFCLLGWVGFHYLAASLISMTVNRVHARLTAA